MLNSLYILLSGDDTSTGGGGGGGARPTASVSGLDFLINGQPDDYRGYTGFRLQELIAKGERGWVSDYIGWVQSMAANSIRWFCRWNNTGYCPEVDPMFFEHFRDTLELLGTFGMFGHPVLTCDQVPGSSVLTTDEKLDKSARLMTEIARELGNVLPLETENEPFKNGMKGRRWPKEWFAGFVSCRGTWNLSSNVDPQEENGTWLSCATIHPGGDREWVSEGGRVCQETMREHLGQFPAPHIPTIVGEPVRIAEEGRTPSQFADHAWNCRNMGRGSLVHGGFHSLGPQTSHHASDLQNCKIPTGDALKCCEAVRDVWKSPLWIKHSASQGTYTRAAVAGPTEGVPGHVPGVGDTTVFPQTDAECPISHWDRWIDAAGVQYEDPRGATRTYFMRMGDGTAIGGPLDGGPQCAPAPRQGYVLTGRDGPIWVLKR
jgi:hypothetical protein